MSKGAVRVFVTGDGHVELEIGHESGPARVGLDGEAADAVAAALVIAARKVTVERKSHRVRYPLASASIRSFVIVPSKPGYVDVVLTSVDDQSQRISLPCDQAVQFAASLFGSGALSGDSVNLIRH